MSLKFTSKTIHIVKVHFPETSCTHADDNPGPDRNLIFVTLSRSLVNRDLAQLLKVTIWQKLNTRIRSQYGRSEPDQGDLSSRFPQRCPSHRGCVHWHRADFQVISPRPQHLGDPAPAPIACQLPALLVHLDRHREAEAVDVSMPCSETFWKKKPKVYGFLV